MIISITSINPQMLMSSLLVSVSTGGMMVLMRSMSSRFLLRKIPCLDFIFSAIPSHVMDNGDIYAL